MARQPYGRRARRRNRNMIYVYTLAGILIIAGAFVYIYWTSGKDRSGPADVNATISLQANTSNSAPEKETIIVFSPPATNNVEPQPSAEPQPGPQPAPITTMAETVVQPVTEPNPEAGVLIDQAVSLLGKDPTKMKEAREIYNEALRMPLNSRQRKYVKEQLAGLAERWLFSRTVLAGDDLSENYKVKSGDLLANIGLQYKVPYEILMQINGISNPAGLQSGQTIKIVKGPFHAKVYRSSFTMDIYLQNTYVKTLPVGLGKTATETPTGLWRVKPGGKSEKPPWTRDDGKVIYPDNPEYPLGSRWIGLEGLEGNAKGRNSFGIHGTKEPDSVGSAVSAGCIRLENGNAILVYNMLVPTYSTVEVID
jgi:lipoprotein-anchoring transpeptidase ErfK/SrfK